MPHAEDDMSQPLVNGEKPQSKAISHITSYPLIADSISAYVSNPLGQKSIDLFKSAYSTFYQPVLPYLQGPYSYVAPYVQKADDLADSGLSEVDKRVPIVKEDTATVKETVKSYIFFPFAIAGQGKQYVVSTWNDEYSKTPGDGYPKLVKGVISTELKIGIDALTVTRDWVNKAVEKVKNKTN